MNSFEIPIFQIKVTIYQGHKTWNHKKQWIISTHSMWHDVIKQNELELAYTDFKI